jgi:hypothetical protein
MAFLIPIIILKGFTLGPRRFFTPEELDSFCDEVDAAETTGLQTTGLQREVDATLQTLTRVHNAMALLQAAMIKPSAWEVKIKDDHGNIVKETKFGNVVAAYADDEVDLFHKAIKAIEKVETDNDTLLGKRLDDKAIQKVKLPTMSSAAPLLELFLKRFQDHGLTEFVRVDCLENCRRSVLNAGFNPEAPRYTAKAFNLLRLLWGQNVERYLADEVGGWLKEIDDLATTEDWLRNKLQLNALSTQIDQLYNSNDDEAKLALGRIAALLDANLEIFPLIYGRFMDKNNGLETTIEDFNNRTHAAPVQQKDWENLLSATYGVIAWKIFRQASLAVEEAQMVLRGV